MTRRCLLGSILMLSITVPAVAQQGLTGTWEGATPGGTAIVLTLKVEKTALTGTLKRGEEESAPLSEGKVTKNTFTFKVTLNGQTEALSGELAGDELKAWLDRQGPEKAIVLRRVKPQGK